VRAFDGADVGPMKAGAFCELFLRHARRSAETFEVVRQDLFWFRNGASPSFFGKSCPK
jgi:hypothetical protein